MTSDCTPIRVQRKRTGGYVMADAAGNGLPVRYCGRPGPFGNPFVGGTRNALARVPAADMATPWEYEGRCSAAGTQHDIVWPGGEVSRHHVRYMTLDEIIATHRRALIAPTKALRLFHRPAKAPGVLVDVDMVRTELAGSNLSCWCPLHRPCHVDTLLWVANAPEHEIKLAAAAEYDLIRASAERVAQAHPTVIIAADER